MANQSISGVPQGLDPKLVKQAARGKQWGEQDQHRYDIASGAKMGQKQTNELKQNNEGGVRKDYAAMQQKEADGVEFSQRAENIYNRMGDRIEKLDARKDAKERANNFTEIKNTQAQNVNQDNDINSTVNGNDNYVYNNQDNSIRQYGGDNRSFVYNSNGEGPDTPATMATLAGFYAPDDSPGATAARLDQHVTMNRDNQKKYADTSWRAQGAIKRAEQNSYIDPQALDKRIADRSKYHMAQSTVKGAEVFGDIYGLESPTWNSSKPAKPVEKPDFDKMYDTYTDF